ncbi:MAG: acyl-ACP--UDP-N-acetylglucosamine O-acyltransferase [Elainellaceae cyanobacterium]
MTALIHPTAVVHPGAQLHPTVRVGPYAVIGEHVNVGAGTVIGAHVVLDGRTEIGDRNEIFPGAAIGLEPQDLKYDGSISLVKIGHENRIREYVTINRATQAGDATVIGDCNLLMAYVHVAHNCLLENHIVIANAVSLAGHVHIESKAVIGGMTGIHQFVHVGQLAMIGGMARVDRDVPSFMLAEGNPCRIRGLNQVGLRRAGLTHHDQGRAFQNLKQAFRFLYRDGLGFEAALEEIDHLGGDDSDDVVHHLRRFLHHSQEKGRRGLTPGRSRNAPNNAPGNRSDDSTQGSSVHSSSVQGTIHSSED